jgi:hypothetical protein
MLGGMGGGGGGLGGGPAEHLLEFLLELLELLLDAVLLLLERLDAHFEAVDRLLEVLLGLVVRGLDEQLADLAVHGRLLADHVQLFEGRLGLVQLGLRLVALDGDLLSLLLKFLQLFDLLLCFRRKVSCGHTRKESARREKVPVLVRRQRCRAG